MFYSSQTRIPSITLVKNRTRGLWAHGVPVLAAAALMLCVSAPRSAAEDLYDLSIFDNVSFDYNNSKNEVDLDNMVTSGPPDGLSDGDEYEYAQSSDQYDTVTQSESMYIDDSGEVKAVNSHAVVGALPIPIPTLSVMSAAPVGLLLGLAVRQFTMKVDIPKAERDWRFVKAMPARGSRYTAVRNGNEVRFRPLPGIDEGGRQDNGAVLTFRNDKTHKLRTKNVHITRISDIQKGPVILTLHEERPEAHDVPGSVRSRFGTSEYGFVEVANHARQQVNTIIRITNVGGSEAAFYPIAVPWNEYRVSVGGLQSVYVRIWVGNKAGKLTVSSAAARSSVSADVVLPKMIFEGYDISSIADTVHPLMPFINGSARLKVIPTDVYFPQYVMRIRMESNRSGVLAKNRLGENERKSFNVMQNNAELTSMTVVAGGFLSHDASLSSRRHYWLPIRSGPLHRTEFFGEHKEITPNEKLGMNRLRVHSFAMHNDRAPRGKKAYSVLNQSVMVMWIDYISRPLAPHTKGHQVMVAYNGLYYYKPIGHGADRFASMDAVQGMQSSKNYMWYYKQENPPDSLNENEGRWNVFDFWMFFMTDGSWGNSG